MNSKRTFLLFCAIVAAYGSVWAQATITIPQENIINGTDYIVNNATTEFSGVSISFPFHGKIEVAASSDLKNTVAGTTNSVLASNLNLKLVSIAGSVPPGTLYNVNLTTQRQRLYEGNFTYANGPLVIEYKIPMINSAWVAGAYQTTLLFTNSNGATRPIIGTNKILTLTVPVFIQALGVQAAPNPVININSFDQFRNTGAATTISLGNISSTIPYNLGARPRATNFSYTPALGNSGINREVSTGILRAMVNTSPERLLIVDRGITNLFSLSAIPVGNRTDIQLRYRIDKADLNANFMYAGDYTTPLTYRVNSAANPTVINSPTSTMLVKVADMGELLIANPTATINFNNAADYVNGKSVELPAHLKISKTTPYDVYVKATTANLTNGANTIPVNVVKVGPVGTQTDVQTVTLSTTPTKLISGAMPVIDREVGIKYTIDATSAKTLVGKAAGDYSVNVTYSFIAN